MGYLAEKLLKLVRDPDEIGATYVWRGQGGECFLIDDPERLQFVNAAGTYNGFAEIEKKFLDEKFVFYWIYKSDKERVQTPPERLMTEKLFWVWRVGDGYHVSLHERPDDPAAPVLSAATYESLAAFFLQEGRNAVSPPAEGYKTKTVVDMTDGEPTPTNDIEAELLKRVYRHNRINP